MTIHFPTFNATLPPPYFVKILTFCCNISPKINT
jgi:hypothetical protein